MWKFEQIPHFFIPMIMMRTIIAEEFYYIFHSGSEKKFWWKSNVNRASPFGIVTNHLIACLWWSHDRWAKLKRSKSFWGPQKPQWQSQSVPSCHNTSSGEQLELNWLLSCCDLFRVQISICPVWTLCRIAAQLESFTVDLLYGSVLLTQQLTE